MLLSKGELAGFGVGLVVIVVMGIIALSGPFHHINKIHAAAGPTVIGKMVDQTNNISAPFQFSPRNYTLKVGQPITFRNASSVAHTVTARDGSFTSGDIPTGQTWTFTPTTPGKYSYYCAYHAYMTGVITVTR
jgi:plastocyanin